MKRSRYYFKLSWLLVALTAVSFMLAAQHYPSRYELYYKFASYCGYSSSVSYPVKRMNPVEFAGYEFTILAIVTTLFAALAIACFVTSRDRTKRN